MRRPLRADLGHLPGSAAARKALEIAWPDRPPGAAILHTAAQLGPALAGARTAAALYLDLYEARPQPLPPGARRRLPRPGTDA